MSPSESSGSSRSFVRSRICSNSSRAEIQPDGVLNSVVGADEGVDGPARRGGPLCVIFLETAFLKAAAKPPVVLRARVSAGGEDSVAKWAAGVPGTGPPVAALVGGLCCVCLFVVSAVGLLSLDEGGVPD